MGRDRPAIAVGRRAESHWLKLRYGLLLAPLVFLALFYLYPLGSILRISLIDDGTIDLSAVREFLASSRYHRIVWFTVWQAALSTLLTLALALPGAYVFTRYRFRGKSLLMSLATLPFVLPTVVVAAAFRALIDENGLVNMALMSLLKLDSAPIHLERSLAMILIAHVFYNYAIALRIISGYWANQTARMEEAARVLGADGWRLWLYIRLPLLRPAILAAGVLVYIFTFTSFGVILILGGLRFSTLEVAIFREARDFFDLPMAATLSLVQIGAMLLMMVVYTALQRQISGDLEAQELIARRPRGWRQRGLLAANLAVMGMLLFAPLAALVARSFTLGGGGFTLDHYAGLQSASRFGNPLDAVANSLRFALVTTALAVLLGVISAYLIGGRRRGRGKNAGRWLDPLFMLPLATSAVTLGFGYIVSMDFNGVREGLNLVLAPVVLGVTGDWDLRTSAALIPMAHTLVALPFVVRSVLPAVRAIPQGVQEAAVVLGASSWQVWRWIDLPLISRGIIVGATFAFTVSMGEFGASVFIARPDTPTMPIIIYNQISRPGAANYGEALAMSVLLMAVCAAAFMLIERARTAGVGEF